MSNSSEQFEDQAQELRQRMHLTNEENEENNKGEQSEFSMSKEEDLNVLNLPPRSEKHKDNNTGYKWKVRYPLIRLLIVLFVILILLIPIYNIWGKQDDSEGAVGSVQSAKASDASYMMELTRQKKTPQSSFGLDNSDEKNDSNLDSKQSNESKSKDEDETKHDDVSSKDGVTPSFIEYKVKEGDTLFSISMNFYNSKDGEQRIIHANHLEAEEIYVGQTLLIPQ